MTAARFAIRMLDQEPPGRSRLPHRRGCGSALGVVAHANSALPSLAGAAAGLLLAALGHAGGWPYPRGGAQRIADAMVADLEQHGGTVEAGTPVSDLGTLDWGDPRRGDLLLLNTSPRLALTHPDVPAGYARALRSYRYGPGAAKVDFALDGPVRGRTPTSPTRRPCIWAARAPRSGRARTPSPPDE